MTFDLLATGESIAEYKPCSNPTIGVNDIFKLHPVDHLLVVDFPDTFTSERLKTIKESYPSHFYALFPDHWEYFFPKVIGVKHYPVRGYVFMNREDMILPYSVSSPFMAVALAWKLGADRINLYGVDFNTHHAMGKGLPQHDTAMKHFKRLYLYLKTKGCEVYCTKQSALSKFMQTL